LPIYNFSVSRDLLRGRLQGPQFRPISLEDTASDLQKLANIDARVLGISREKHHGIYSTTGRREASAFIPQTIALVIPTSAPHRTARRRAARRAWLCVYDCAGSCGGDWFSTRDGLPGASEAALRIAVEHGMRITFPMLLMSTRDFGDWTGYLPRNPGFM
jgi:hypothetical protein